MQLRVLVQVFSDKENQVWKVENSGKNPPIPPFGVTSQVSSGVLVVAYI